MPKTPAPQGITAVLAPFNGDRDRLRISRDRKQSVYRRQRTSVAQRKRHAVCPGIERKRPDIHFDRLLGDTAAAPWAGKLEQALLLGNRWISEVAFFHRQTRTLILVDLIEKFTYATSNIGWKLKLRWKVAFHAWNIAKPAPEYQLGWSDKKAARASLNRILQWDFESVIPAHGDLIEADVRPVVEKAW